MKIQLVLVDDWELRGDGSGDIRHIQFETLSSLLAIYERYGLRASINAEVMQQLAHLEWGARYPELRDLAWEWEALVRESYARGHDVQLHVHPQWRGAHYKGSEWALPGDWSILRYPAEVVREMLRACTRYLEGLLRPLNPEYRCVSFRSGSWCIAPSAELPGILADCGFTFDISIVAGMMYDNEKIQLDYRGCEEDFLPYYPDMVDARRLAISPARITCVPTLTFRPPRRYLLHQDLLRLLRWLPGLGRWLARSPRPQAPNETPAPGAARHAPYAVWQTSTPLTLKTRITARLSPSWRIGDLSSLPFPLMRLMVQDIRRRARRRGWEVVPIVLENHTKDIGDFGPIEAFAAYVAGEPDLEVITLTELHRHLTSGRYRPVMGRAPLG